MAEKSKLNRQRGMYLAVFVASIVAGIIGLVVSSIIYGITKEILWSPLAVGISFAVFATTFILCMAIVSVLFQLGKKEFSRGGETAILPFLFIIGTLILGTLFEFIYEVDFFSQIRGYQEPTAYIFLIDNSGSMEVSDPEAFRYDAIEKIISQKPDDFPYAVYGFSDGVWTQRELSPAYEGVGELDSTPGGGTAIRGTLDKFFEDYENGLKEQLGSSPKILLLSDGEATDVGFFAHIDKTLSNYSKADLPVSTVGLGDCIDEDLMHQIADETGGVYISSQDVDQLESAMQNAISQYSKNRYARTLYTRRKVPSLGVLYAIMRIFFTGILSVGISLSMLFVAKDSPADEKLIVLSSIATGVLSGLIMEMGINLLNLPPSIIRIVFFILTALTFIHEPVAGGAGKSTDIGNMPEWNGYKLLPDEDKKTLDQSGSGYDTSWDDF